jgi:hypothetical protein
MKTQFLRILITFLALSSLIYSQEQPKSILVDEFGKIYCDDFLARIDYLLSELQKRPYSEGFVVINGLKSDIRRNLIYENWIKGHIRFRGFDNSRLMIVRSELAEKIRFRLWLVAKGSKTPDFSEAKWDLTLPPNTSSYIFTKTDSQEGLCPGSEYLSLNTFSEYLKANLSANGNFVINTYSRRLFNNEKAVIKNILVNKYNIESRRLRFFYVFDNKYKKDKYYYPRVEVWLVPKKNSR